jgi:hypothetical protein
MQVPPPDWINWLFNHPPFFYVFFAIMWVSIVYLLGIVSGWNALSKRFRSRGRSYGESWPFRSARMRFYVHFGNCLSVGADVSGLYLAVFPIFRPGLPPPLTPWSEIAVISGGTGLIFKKRELRLGRHESIPLRISTSLFQSLRQSAGEAWPPESFAI